MEVVEAFTDASMEQVEASTEVASMEVAETSVEASTKVVEASTKAYGESHVSFHGGFHLRTSMEICGSLLGSSGSSHGSSGSFRKQVTS